MTIRLFFCGPFRLCGLAGSRPRFVPPVIPETEKDRRRYQEAQIRRTHRLARRRAIKELREQRVAEGLDD